jgi:hypothetical protein
MNKIMNNTEIIYNERYKLLDLIGQGAQATVYKIEDLKDNNKMYKYN